MRSVGGDISDERLVGFGLFSDELFCVFKEDVGAISFELGWFTVQKISVIKVSVVPVVWGLSHSTSTMSQDVCVTSVFGAERIVVP